MRKKKAYTNASLRHVEVRQPQREPWMQGVDFGHGFLSEIDGRERV